MTSLRSILKKLDREDISRSIVVSNVPPGTKEEALVIHFQQRKHGGGDVSAITLTQNGNNAIITFEDAETLGTVLNTEHKIEGSLLKVDCCLEKRRIATEVFSEVTARLDPINLEIQPHECKQILDKVGVPFEHKDQLFLIRGSLREINECQILLQKYLQQDEEISDKFSKFSLIPKHVSAEKESVISTSPTSKTLNEDNNGIIIATPVYDNLKEKELSGKMETEEANEIVDPIISDIQTFKTDRLAFSFMKQFYMEQMQDIAKECHVSFDAVNFDTQVTVKPRQDCVPTRYNDACSRFFTLLNSASQGMTAWELDVKGGGEEAAVSFIRYLSSKYPVILDKLSKNGPFVVYGDSASVEQVKLMAQVRMSEQIVGGDMSFEAQHLGATGSGSVSIVTYSYCTDDGVNISLRYGDITSENVDAIVNPANEFLQHGAGLADYVVQKGGNQVIQSESDNLIFEKRRGKPLNLGEAVHTNAGNLPCRYVIHAVGPEWEKQSERKTISLLEKATVESLKVAGKLGLSSIALPAISSGVFCVPLDMCAFAMLNGVEQYLDQLKRAKSHKKEDTEKADRKGKKAEKKKDRNKPMKKESGQEAGGARIRDIRFVLIDANAMDVFEKECVKRLSEDQTNTSSDDGSL